ncbi:hypothetical protein PO909_000272 [Leuciscus waleckii]
METLFRVRNETAATPNSDVNEASPSLQISDQFWWISVLLIIIIMFLLLMCFILRKTIFRFSVLSDVFREKGGSSVRLMMIQTTGITILFYRAAEILAEAAVPVCGLEIVV